MDSPEMLIRLRERSALFKRQAAQLRALSERLLRDLEALGFKPGRSKRGQETMGRLHCAALWAMLALKGSLEYLEKEKFAPDDLGEVRVDRHGEAWLRRQLEAMEPRPRRAGGRGRTTR